MTSLRKLLTAVAFLITISLACSSCQSMSSIKGASQDFVTATNTLVQAESDYFDEIQAASDSAHQLRAASDYVANDVTFDRFTEEFIKRDDFSKAKQARLAVMRQLQNYAEVIAAISSGADASWISDDADKLIKNSNKLIADTKGTKLSTEQAGLIQTVVTKLGQAVIDAASAKKLQVLAQQAQEPIALIANMIDQDNENIEGDKFAEGLVTDQKSDLVNILHVLYQDPRVNSEQRFSAVLIVKDWKPSLITKGQAIKAAIVKLQDANNAMAKKQNQSAIALIKQAYTLATSAINPSSSK